MLKDLKVVVFDLDGTLADTAKLGTGYRNPADVLRYSRAFEKQNIYLFQPTMKWVISNLIQCGIHVYIITRAPKSYASSLVHLLEIDFCGLIPADPSFSFNSKFHGIPEKLRTISDMEKVDKLEMLYIGDTDVDRESAREFGCWFQKAPWLQGDEEDQDYFSDLIKATSAVVNKEQIESVGADILEAAYQRTLLNLTLFENSSAEDWNLDENSLLNDVENVNWGNFLSPPMQNEIVFKPFINPDFITRFEYERNQVVLHNLFEVINGIDLGSSVIRPPYLLNNYNLPGITIHANHKYRANVYGSDLWHLVKDWHGPNNSGPNVHLHYLELIALCMAASMYLPDAPALIVPIPASTFSDDKPGEVSNRLALRISDLAEIPLLNLFSKNENRLFIPNQEMLPFSRDIFLIDDQLTTGSNVEQVLKALEELGIELNRVQLFVWTSTKFELLPILLPMER